MINDKQPIILGDGKQIRDFTFVKNIVSANLKACEAGRLPEERIFNCAYGSQISIQNLVNELNNILGKNISPLCIVHALEQCIYTKENDELGQIYELNPALQVNLNNKFKCYFYVDTHVIAKSKALIKIDILGE